MGSLNHYLPEQNDRTFTLGNGTPRHHSRSIEQMGKVLAYILHDFLRLSGDVPVTQAMEETDHRLQNELDLDLKRSSACRKSS